MNRMAMWVTLGLVALAVAGCDSKSLGAAGVTTPTDPDAAGELLIPSDPDQAGTVDTSGAGTDTTVVGPPPTNHEPDGMTAIFYMDGTTKDWGSRITGYGGDWGDPKEGATGPFTGKVSVVDDLGAPRGKAVEVRWDVGDGGFGAAAFINNNFGGPYREVYYRFIFRFNPNWEQHPATTKFMLYGTEKSNSQFVINIVQRPGIGDNLLWLADQSAAGDAITLQPIWGKIEDFLVTWGDWHVIELHHVLNSAPDAADGYVRAWLDGKEMGPIMTWVTHGDFDFSAPNWEFHSGTEFWNGVQLGSYWGGSGTKSQSDWMRWGEIYISVKDRR